MPGGIGPLELVIVLVIVLVVFGPKRLPGLGRALGSGMREFKESVTRRSRDDEDEQPDPPAAIAASSSGAPASPQTTDQRDDAVSQPRG